MLLHTSENPEAALGAFHWKLPFVLSGRIPNVPYVCATSLFHTDIPPHRPVSPIYPPHGLSRSPYKWSGISALLVSSSWCLRWVGRLKNRIFLLSSIAPLAGFRGIVTKAHVLHPERVLIPQYSIERSPWRICVIAGFSVGGGGSSKSSAF